MTSVDQLLEQFIEAYRTGGDTDPAGYLDKVEGVDREELGALLSAFLERAPRPAVDVEAMAGTPAGDVLDRVMAGLEPQPATWNALLPALRMRAKLKRGDLVARLAEALGATGREQKVASYYHQMEQGQLDPTRVSDRVLEALSDLLGESAAALRKAGAAFTPGPAAAQTFARAVPPDPDFEGDADMPAPPPSPGTAEWDEVDELFRGPRPS